MRGKFGARRRALTIYTVQIPGMAANQYMRVPTRIGMVGPRGATATVWMAGTVSHAVDRALTAPHRTAAQRAVLRREYGSQWQAVCAPAGPPGTGAAGGSELEDLIFDTEELASMNRPHPAPARAAAVAESTRRVVAGPAPGPAPATRARVSDYTLYVEDSVAEVREKVFLATGVPPFRQHLAWLSGEAGLATSYRLYLNDTPFGVPTPALWGPPGEHAVLGMPVDEAAASNRSGMTVEAREHGTLVRDIPHDGRGGLTFWLFDMEAWIGPVRPQLTGTTEDLVRFGFVALFWPQLGQAWPVYARRPRDIPMEYPGLSPGLRELAGRYDAEREGMNREIDRIGGLLGLEKAVPRLHVGVRSAVLAVDTGADTCGLSALFESVPLSGAVPASRLWDRIAGTVVVRVFGRRDRAVPWPAEFSGSGVTFAVRVGRGESTEDVSQRFRTTIEAEQARFVFVHIDAGGSARVRLTFAQGTGESFHALHPFAVAHGAAVFRQIALHAAGAFSPRLDRFTGTAAERFTLALVTARLRWPAAVSDAVFLRFRASVGRLAAGGIVHLEDAPDTRRADGKRVRASRNEFSFEQRKGVPESASARVLEAEYGTGYAGLTNASAHALAERSAARVVLRATNRISDIAIGLSQVDEETFLSVYSEMLVLLHDLRDEGAFRAQTRDGARERRGRHRLRRLQMLDPVRFSLKTHGSPFVYSRLCQTGQPTGVGPHDFAGMPAGQRAKFTRLHNFTTGSDAFYACPDPRLPNLAFITDKHPLGICLPCCAKSLPAPDGPRAVAFARCMSEPHAAGGPDAPGHSDRRHVIGFGRDIGPGRVARLPPVLSTLFYDTLDAAAGNMLHAVGVPQHIFGEYGGGAWSALAFALGRPLADVFGQCADMLARSPALFLAADGGGLAQVFARDDLVGMLRRGKRGLSDADRRRVAEYDRWDELALELAAPVFKVYFVLFAECAGRSGKRAPADETAVSACASDGMFSWTSSSTAAALAGSGGLPMVFGVRHPEGNVYPVAEMNTSLYIRSGALSASVFPVGHNVSALVRNMFAAHAVLQASRSPPGPPSAASLAAFVATGKWSVRAVFVTRRGSASGVVLRGPGGGLVHVPLASSRADEAGLFPRADVRHGPFFLKEWRVLPGALAEWIVAYNRFAGTVVVQHVPGAAAPARFRPHAPVGGLSPVWARAGDGSREIVGAAAHDGGVFWLHGGRSLPRMPVPWRAPVHLGTHPDTISRAAGGGRALPVPGDMDPGQAAITSDAMLAEFRAAAYPMVLAAATRWLSQKRNTRLRGKIERALSGARRPHEAAIAVVAVLRAARGDDLSPQETAAHAVDEKVLQGMLRDAAGGRWRPDFRAEMGRRVFYFDGAGFLSARGADAAMDAVVGPDARVLSRMRAGPGMSPNNAPACEQKQGSSVYCARGKLAMHPSWLKEIRALLRAAFTTPGTAQELLTAPALVLTPTRRPGVGLPPRFTSRPGEYVHMYTEQSWVHGESS